VRGSARLNVRSLLKPRAVILHAVCDEITTLGPNVLMTEHTHPFDLTFPLWSATIEHDQLPVGEHDFPFEFGLPPGLPPTYDGELVKISYRLLVKVDRPLHTDLQAEQPLVVRVPMLADVNKPVRASTSAHDGLKIELDLDHSGYFPGDHVTGTLLVTGIHPELLKSATVDLVSREKAQAHDFVDHVETVRVRAEIDPAQLFGPAPLPLDLPIPADADPSFSSQRSSKTRLVRIKVELADNRTLTTEAVIRVGTR
jgi:hypothetical protein